MAFNPYFILHMPASKAVVVFSSWTQEQKDAYSSLLDKINVRYQRENPILSLLNQESWEDVHRAVRIYLGLAITEKIEDLEGNCYGYLRY